MVFHPHVSEWPQIVVCEPDELTRRSICDRLTADHFTALPAPTGADALRLCRVSKPDLMLLDAALPDGSGIQLLRRVRQADGGFGGLGPRLGVIMLSGAVAETVRIRALEEGADDYVSRPASYEELRGRITAVLRRTRGDGESQVQIADLVLDPARRKVSVGDREVSLTKKQFDLLQVFAADPTRVFTKTELGEAMGNRSAPQLVSRAVDSQASRLRRRLDPDQGRFIVNCWGVGYSLVAADSPAVIR